MTIDEVIGRTIVALYADPALARSLLLKGGGAMRLFDELADRLSIDADFSVAGAIEDTNSFFHAIETAVSTGFVEADLDVIDFRIRRRPRKSRKDRPDWWGGWACEFKLVAREHRGKALTTRRRHALIPDGANSPKILLDISEHEYCGKRRAKRIHGVRVSGYSREMLVLEKLRAICQQHPDYEYRISKNRSRDFFDIHALTCDVDGEFIRRCRHHLGRVFAAKEVPLHILGALWDEGFVDELGRGFDQVRDTVKGTPYDFGVYVEHVRFLVREITPETLPPKV